MNSQTKKELWKTINSSLTNFAKTMPNVEEGRMMFDAENALLEHIETYTDIIYDEVINDLELEGK
jgi:hypothetical protein